MKTRKHISADLDKQDKAIKNMGRILLKQVKGKSNLRQLANSIHRNEPFASIRYELLTGIAADQYSIRICYHKDGDVSVSYLSKTAGMETVTFSSVEWDCLVIYMGHLADMKDQEDGYTFPYDPNSEHESIKYTDEQMEELIKEIDKTPIDFD